MISQLVRSTAFLSYKWGRSHSPAYAFKNRKGFDEELRQEIVRLFGWMAYARFRQIGETAYVIGAPPRTTIQWGMQDHLDDLLLAVEQANFCVLRNVFAFEDQRLVVTDASAASIICGAPVIVVDNLLNTRKTARKMAAKLRELGAAEIHLCILARWIEGRMDDIGAAERYRDSLCATPEEIDEWYWNAFCEVGRVKKLIATVADTNEGFHVAAANLARVMPLIEERMELTGLIPGTLNVWITEDYTAIARAVITPDEYGHNETVKLQRCLVNGYKAVIMRPDTHETIPGWGHGKNHLELMGRVSFRAELQLQDGDRVTVEVEGDDAWWESGR